MRGYRLARDALMLIIHDDDDVGRLVFKEAPVIAGGDDKRQGGCDEEGREGRVRVLLYQGFPFSATK